MNDCINAEARDALPELLHGRLSDLDRATMNAHVESCADCRAELALMERVRAYAPLAPTIDVSRIVAALPVSGVVADYQVPSVTTRSRSSMASLWKVAAVAAVMVAGVLTFNNARQPAPPVRSVAATTPVASAPLQTAASAAAPAAAPAETRVAVAAPAVTVTKVNSAVGLSLTGGVQDLSDAQLEALLKEVDNVDGLPAAEPEPVSVSVDGDEGL